MDARVLAVLLAAAFSMGWTANGWRLGLQHMEQAERLVAAQVKAERRARDEEQRRIAALEQVQQDAEHQIAEAAAAAVAAERSADGLRVELDRLRNRPARCPATAADSEAAAPAHVVLADVLSWMEQRGRELAAEADRRGVAGRACVQAYTRVGDQ